MGLIFELEESEFAGWIDDGLRYPATVIGIKKREKPFKDDAGQPIVRVEFHFKLIADDGHDGQDIWGDTSNRFNSHPECVVEGTEVLPIGHLLGATKAFYEGPVVHLMVRPGKRLTVTMNHPVLTARGWLPAHEVGEGDQILRYTCADPARAREQFDHVPARVEDVFDALEAVADSAPTAAAPSHFHNDGQFMQGQVDVVRADGELRYRIEASGAKNAQERRLVERARLAEALVGGGPALPAEDADLLAPTGPVRRIHRGGVVASVAHRDPSFPQAIEDRDLVAADLFADLRDRGASEIALDQVVDVEVESFAGHVYNLHTTSNAYFANRIATHNCRLKQWSEAILGMHLTPHFRLDTDMLLDRHCFVVVGKKEYQKDGETKFHNFVRDVQPTTANAKALAERIDEPF